MATKFGIVGGGFRSRIYLEIARRLPAEFRVVGLVVRNREQAAALEQSFGVAPFATLSNLLRAERPDFMVLSVPSQASFEYLVELHQRGMDTLTETPPAPNLEGLLALHRLTRDGARIQVAEQYRFRPMMAARQRIIASGRIGVVTQCDVSISHGYHGVNLIRTFLDIGFEPVKIRGMRFQTAWTQGPDRQGPPSQERLVSVARDLAWFDFGEKLGVFDFTQNQHRSWIRKTHMTVGGTHGEIQDEHLRYLSDYRTPMELPLLRVERGRDENVEEYGLQGITLGETWIYRNPYPQARLGDEEIAVATMLGKMAEYSRGGPDFYDLRQASQDQYLALLLHQAIERQELVASAHQPWMTETP